MNGEKIEQQRKSIEILSQDEKNLPEKLKQDPSKLDINFLKQKLDTIENNQEKTHLQKIIDKINATQNIKNFIKNQIDSQISEEMFFQIFVELGDSKIEKISSFISDRMAVGKIFMKKVG